MLLDLIALISMIVSKLTTSSLMTILPIQFLTEICIMRTTSKKKHFKPICAMKQTWQQNQEGEKQSCFPQFCEVGGLAIANKRKQSNLAGNIFKCLLSFGELQECTILSKYGNFRLFSLKIWRLWPIFFLKNSLYSSHKIFFVLAMLGNFTTKENTATARMSQRRAIKVSSSGPFSVVYSLFQEVFSSICAFLPEFSDHFSLSIQWQGSFGNQKIYQGS